jgi:hypothetical protein
MYAMAYADCCESKKCKGIKKAVVAKDVNFDDYINVLKTTVSNQVSITNIRSKSHTVKTVQENKVCLSAYDDKRYIHDNGVSSYAYGNCNIAVI